MIFRFADPLFLVLLLPVVYAVIHLSRRRKRGDARLVLPGAGAVLKLGSGPWVRFERFIPWMRGLSMLLLVFAIARPQSGTSQETVSTHGVDIVVAIDTSQSMRAEDFQPLNRLEVARTTIARFVEGRPSDRVGIVSFASLATTRCPLTQDHAMLQDLLAGIKIAPKDETGTAIGMGLATAVNRMRNSSAKSKVVVLITDGRNNEGQIGPEAAAEIARALGVKVYTIGVGTDGVAPIPVDTPYGTRYVQQRVDIDEELLRRIAANTDGRYFRATDPEGLQTTFETIDALEKTEIESKVRVMYAELFPAFLAPAGLLLLLELVLVNTRMRRIP